MTDLPHSNEHNRLRIIIGVLCGAFLAALDTTILATVMPTIVTDLGGLSLYSWVFSIYMIMTAVSMPLWGKISDMLGRRNLFVASVVTFLAGSFLCGLSQSMLQLIMFRGLQGIGAGGLSAVPFALISTVFPSHERGKAIGLISSTWGISSVLGPLLGSFVAVHLDWRWVFYINIPLGILAIVLVVRFYRDLIPHHTEKVDYLGGVLLAFSIISLLLISMRISEAGIRVSIESFGYLAFFSLCTLAFIVQERRAKNPILHMEFFKRRPFWLGNLLGFMSSFTMYAVIAFMPLFSQSVQGGSALQAGLVITPMSLGWSASSVFAGRYAYRVGEKNLIRLGLLVLFLGFVLSAGIETSSPAWYLAVCVSICGMGMGIQTPSLLLTVQNSLDIKNLGVATSSQMLARTIGGAIGVSMLGAIMSGSMTHRFMTNVVSAGHQASDLLRSHIAEPQELLSQRVRPLLSANELGFVLQTFTEGLHLVFMIGLGILLVCLALTFFLPVPERHGIPGNAENSTPDLL